MIKKSKENVVNIIIITMFFLIIWLPLIQLKTKFVKPMRISNIGKTKKVLPLTFENYTTGAFQKSLETFFQRKHGFWGYLVRTENQLNFSLFNQISSNYKLGLKVGNDKWLFHGLYLENFNRSRQILESDLVLKTNRLKKLQDLLNKKGIGLTVLISSNSIEAHPEIVPDQYFDKTRKDRKSTYEKILPMLTNAGVNVVDAHAIFLERSQGDKRKYFTPSGSHWNDVGACEVSQELSKKMAEVLKKETTEIICTPISFRNIPRSQDLDLQVMANLWNRDFYHQLTPYTQSSKITSENTFRPKVLIVGTSFIWSILNYFDKHKVYSASDFWYYYNRVRTYPGNKQKPLDRSTIDWNGNFLDYNFVILEINVAIIESIGFDFLNDAISHLEEEN